MEVILYYTNADNSSLTKDLQLISTLQNVHPVDALNVAHPVFKIGSPSMESLLRANYAYVPDLHRYYFISPPTLGNNNINYVQFDVDPLMSFKEYLLKLPAVIDKTQDSDFYNLDYNDGSFVNQEGRFLEITKFSNGFDETATNILIVAGG